MLNMDLLEIRQQIDAVDKQLIALFEERMQLCHDVAEYKIETGKKIFDRQREQEKIAAAKELASNDFNAMGAQELLELLMSLSRKMQYRMLAEHGTAGKLPFIAVDALDTAQARVVFQGAEGAYSQIATRKFFGEGVNAFHVDTFRDAMRAIEEGSADYAVLPIENSTAGIIRENYELLVEFEHYIVGEITIPIEHCLLVVPGTKEEQIRSIYSHPQSLMQSAQFLNARNWQQISMQNNAFAARKVAEDGDPSQAAIASDLAGQTYGLEVLRRGINQSDTNSTRFIVVTNQKIFCRNASRITVCFEVPHESGSLYHMLSHFIFNHLNLCRIESCPVSERDWEYRFFVDFDGNLADSAVKNAIRGLREETRSLTILGNY